jgi:hypothetical protein
MKKKTYIFGILFGVLVPFIGIFVGLQISTTLGNILTFPVVAVSFITGTPFGMWNPTMWLLATVFSIAIWTAIFFIISKALNTQKSQLS